MNTLLEKPQPIAEKQVEPRLIKVPQNFWGCNAAALGYSNSENLKFTDGKLTECKYINWHTCRESFSDCFTHHTKFFFFNLRVSKPDNQFVKLVEFLAEVENRLGLTVKTQVIKTSEKRTVAIRVPTWWSSSIVRRQFYTALLRAGLRYSSVNDFDSALYGAKYFTNTKDAVKRFMEGYTKLSESISMTGLHGWSRTFSSGKNLNKLLK